jgi:hypothetical protein
MVPDTERHKLDQASRINYAKVYTVEHNVKVSFIGRIAQKYEQQVTTDYNETHGLLPDRPTYKEDVAENVFEHAEGMDPRYPAQSYPAQSYPAQSYPAQPTAGTSWPTTHAQESQDYNAFYDTTTMTSSYGPAATSTWSVPQNFQPSSSYTSPTTYYIPPSPAPYSQEQVYEPIYESHPTVTEPISQAYEAAPTYDHHSEDIERGTGTREETEKPEEKAPDNFDPDYDVSD